MIVFLSEGGLGNQIFQFAFLASYAEKNEKIIVWGFEDIKSLFDVKDKRFFIFSIEDKILELLPKNFPPKLKRALKYRVLLGMIRYGLVRKVLEVLAKSKIISSVSLKTQKICEDTYIEFPEVVFSEGIISSVKYVARYFFQSERLFRKDVLKNLEFKEKYVKEAEKFISKYQDYYKVAVHIRLGDFRNYYICGENPILPFDYFHKKIRWFLENQENPFFIFLSDEPDKIKNEFSYLEDKMVISENPYQVDFIIITMCDAAIISCSSFSWWGAYFMKQRDIVFAPKDWIWFKMKRGDISSSFPSFAIPCEV
jgi:hypothetical protein